MSGQEEKTENMGLSKGFINLQDPYLNSIIKNQAPNPLRKSSNQYGTRMSRYFTLKPLFLLVCLTASLLILPLILPPLPPPPFMLLLLPICILAVLMVLAFMPSNVREMIYCFVYLGSK
ncbi:protein AUXIN-REGULATED GENE INVOLVED IN ORGAN SIZE-like [Primulina huaijiensis]|uniref:protein AUXIN-REGULATED GENE INVOLVED IN ORGAN SIZE-like n=1 Tax=Primulina huaijiensis TaxID=1492673 RepID=UPI003CC765B5